MKIELSHYNVKVEKKKGQEHVSLIFHSEMKTKRMRIWDENVTMQLL